jgi:hypothetical protein
VAAARRDFEGAARLIGAADPLPYTVGSFEPPFEHATYDRCVAEVRATLGAEIFAQAFAAGRELALEESLGITLASEMG